MRVLFSSNPMYGHVNTMLALASCAQRAGHDVVFATGRDFDDYVRRRGLETWVVGPDSAPTGRSVDWIDFFIAAALERVSRLTERAVSWRADIVIHEDTEFAAAASAIETGAVHAVHGLTQMLPVRMWPMLEPALDAIIAAGGGAVPAVAVRDALFLDVCPPSLQPAADDRVWHRVQPIRHSAGAPEHDETLATDGWDLPHERTVHLTLGTVFNGEVDVMSKVIDGLSDLPFNLVVTVGPEGDPTRFGERRGLVVERYLPHAALLAHCDAVVSHAGAGILYGALAHGLPQLALPLGADQHENAAALVRAGAGLALDPDTSTSADIRDNMMRLLGDPSFTRSACKVRDEIAAMPSPDEVVALLSTLAADRRS